MTMTEMMLEVKKRIKASEKEMEEEITSTTDPFDQGWQDGRYAALREIEILVIKLRMEEISNEK